MSMIEISYRPLLEFFNDYFTCEALQYNEEAEHALDLLDIAMEELFEEEYDPDYVQVLLNQMHSFRKLPMHNNGKALYLRQHIGVEMVGLDPLEFLEFVHLRMKAEVWKKR